MKILHTSDWHLGKKTERMPRLAEQREVLSEIIEIVRGRGVDIVLIAGDVFDTFTPPAEAEELLYDTLAELSRHAVVVVIPGNHDDANRLCAADPLAVRNGIFLLSDWGAAYSARSTGKIVLTGAGAGHLTLDKSGEKLNIAYLPYPTPVTLDRYDDEKGELDEPFAVRVERRLKAAVKAFAPDAHNIILSHLFASGAEMTGDEAEIQLGGARAVEKTRFPHAGYTALGHIHKFQRIGGDANIYYSGSILQYSFDDQSDKAVALVELCFGKAAVVERVPLTRGKRLCRLEASSLVDAEELLRSHAHCLCELTLNLSEPLSGRESRALGAGFEQLVKLKVNLPERVHASDVQRDRMGGRELFTAFYRSVKGGEPSEELVKLFLEILE